MCAILDADILYEVFGTKTTKAGSLFLTWINKGKNRLVVGEALLKEINNRSFTIWLNTAEQSGKVLRMDEEKDSIIDKKKRELEAKIKSDDPHIIALAQVSGARMLYSGEEALHADFKNNKFLKPTGGHVYPRKEKRKVILKFLSNEKLCEISPRKNKAGKARHSRKR